MPSNTFDSEPLAQTTAPTRLKVGIQGYAGAFHEIAARAYFSKKDITIVPAHTFDDLVAKLCVHQEIDTALMAIENTLVGSIMPNYHLLLDHDVWVQGEYFLRIHQNLLTLPGVRIQDLQEVHSHPVAIAQCKTFFEAYPHIHLVETADTALSAKHIRDYQRTDTGAIASELAAHKYGLQVLHKNIETNKNNHTRFWVLQRPPQTSTPNANKISLSYTLRHEAGSLHKVLAVLAAYGVSLTKIQSAPIIGKPWEYRFFIDFTATDKDRIQIAINGIRPIVEELTIFGIYPQGQKSEA